MEVSPLQTDLGQFTVAEMTTVARCAKPPAVTIVKLILSFKLRTFSEPENDAELAPLVPQDRGEVRMSAGEPSSRCKLMLGAPASE